jgi:hypothetical protein
MKSTYVAQRSMFAAAGASVVLGLTLGSVDANAVSARVKFACARDYLAHCRAFRPDTPEVRHCMRGVGARLSPRCVNALVASGEVSQREVARRAAALRED